MRGPFGRGWRRCICVASGPSLSFDGGWQIERIKQAQREGWRVLVANATWARLPWADVVFGADRKFWNTHAAAIAGGFAGERWTGNDHCAKVHRINLMPTRWEVDQRSGLKAGLARDGSYIRHNGNTGAHLVATAYAFGMEVGILVGFDMQQTGGTPNAAGHLEGGPIHHHGPHVNGLANPSPLALAMWATRIAVMARDLGERNVVVLNASIETALTCFPREPLDEALERYGERAAA